MATAMQAQDTFTVTFPDGAMHRVVKGEVRSDRDPVVRHVLESGGTQFKPMDMGEDEPEKPARRTKAAS
jgi:hypothetical protein